MINKNTWRIIQENNIKVLGIQEPEGDETWEESEKLVKDAINGHLKIEDDPLTSHIALANHVPPPPPPFTAMLVGQRLPVNQQARI